MAKKKYRAMQDRPVHIAVKGEARTVTIKPDTVYTFDDKKINPEHVGSIIELVPDDK